MKILCIGDSNTYGYDPRSPLGSRYPAEVRWTEQLEHQQVINWGMNGKRVPTDASVFVDVIRKKEPDLVILMFGNNDLLEGDDAEKTTQRMEGFLDSLSETEKPILLIAPPPLQRSEYVQSEALIEESRKLEELYRDIARKKDCLFIAAGQWGIEMAFDGIHFSSAGHMMFAQKLEEALIGKKL